MKLYYTPGACSLSPHIVALEAGLPLNLVRVQTAPDGKKTAGPEDFLMINPKGYVPALQLDGGEVLTEGPAIVQYLANQKPGSDLMPPAGSLARYRVLEWLGFINSEIHKSFTPLFNPTASDQEKQAAKANLDRRFKYIEGKLAGAQHLTGAAFTVADAYLFVVLGWTRFVKIDLSSFDNITAYMGRIAARPKVQEAMRAEGLIKG